MLRHFRGSAGHYVWCWRLGAGVSRLVPPRPSPGACPGRGRALQWRCHSATVLYVSCPSQAAEQFQVSETEMVHLTKGRMQSSAQWRAPPGRQSRAELQRQWRWRRRGNLTRKFDGTWMRARMPHSSTSSSCCARPRCRRRPCHLSTAITFRLDVGLSSKLN